MKKADLAAKIPQAEYPRPEVFSQEAIRLVNEASKRGIVLRIMGGLAIYLHSKNFEGLWNSIGRLGEKVFTDIDFMSRLDYSPKILAFLKENGYEPPYRMAMFDQARKRMIYRGGTVPIVDVFFDQLDMCHRIDLRKRLEVDSPTIPLAELLLEKLEIVRINEKDIKDVIVLVRAHDIADNDNEAVNIAYISKLLSADWGFYYTATTNLQKILDYLPRSESISDEDRKHVSQKVNEMLSRIDKTPKTMVWKMREKVGTRKRWYTDVEEQ